MTAEDLQMETSPAVIDRRYSTLGREVQHVSNKCEKGAIGFNRGALGRDNRASPGPVAELSNRRRSQDAHGIPGLLVILNERDASYRQIFTDHRPLPTIDLPSFNGFSSGKWDGDTLVVETTGFKDGMWLDRNGSPMTDAAKVTERFRRVNYGKMEIEITVDDPKAYTAPWTIKLNHFIVLDTELLDYICLENEKDIPRLLGK